MLSSGFRFRATTGLLQEGDGPTPIKEISPTPLVESRITSVAITPGPTPSSICPTSMAASPSNRTEAVALGVSTTVRVSLISPSEDRKNAETGVSSSAFAPCKKVISVELPAPATAVGKSTVVGIKYCSPGSVVVISLTLIARPAMVNSLPFASPLRLRAFIAVD